MKNFKRIFAGLMAGTTALSFAACTTESSSSTSSSTESANSTYFTTIDDEIENPVSIDNISIDAGDKVEPAELIYLGCYDITTAGDVKPAYKYFSANYDCTIKCTIVGSLQILEKLTTAISSGDSPDLVDYADSTFPLIMSKNMYTPLDEYMDLSAPQWSGLEEYINNYRWNGNNYYYPWAYNVSPYFLVYNRGLYEELGIEDPKELYDEGNWTWDTMTDCIRKFIDSDVNGERTGLYGATAYAAQSIINSTGTPLISVGDDGKLVGNFDNANVDRAANFMQSLKKEGLASFQEGVIDVDTVPIKDGTAAFQAMGEWIISGYARDMTKDDTLDYFFVPFPRDPSADDYYYSMTTFGYLVPAGSKYAKQASVFINCCRLSNTDEDLKATTKESIMKNKKYTDGMYDSLIGFKEINNFKAIVDEPYGLDETTGQIIKDILGNTLFDLQNETYAGQSWTQMREANIGAINKQIDYYNGLLSKDD
ncbi:MAG: extracellular solute-binding protein [Lachnospiraceae bacterium]|nr:extracellular solute-binding protein [Lachnospiraceae bacterium]